MKLDPENQAAAETHMREMVGNAIGVVLLAADDLDETKANLLASVEEFPAAMREVSPEVRTVILEESTRNVRLHARSLYKILGGIINARAEEAGMDPGEARLHALAALADSDADGAGLAATEAVHGPENAA